MLLFNPVFDNGPYYAALLRGLPSAGGAVPDNTTCRAFALTHTALCARDSADVQAFLPVAVGPWRSSGV